MSSNSLNARRMSGLACPGVCRERCACALICCERGADSRPISLIDQARSSLRYRSGMMSVMVL